jgi:hypothetical protein
MIWGWVRPVAFKDKVDEETLAAMVRHTPV